MTKKSDFKFKKLPLEAQDKSIKRRDFKLVDNTKRVHEQRFQTRPTTFFKDSLKRFAKNKSSVVASVILGILVVLAIFEPMIDPYPVKTDNSASMTYLEPKLFDAGTGFWDGTRVWEKIPTYIPTLPDGSKETNQENWWPNPDKFSKTAVSNKKFSDLMYTSSISSYGKGGYINLSFSRNFKDDFAYYRSNYYAHSLSLDDTIYLKTFDIYDESKLLEFEGDKPGVELPVNFVSGEVELYFGYSVGDPSQEVNHRYVKILDAEKTFNIGSAIESKKEEKVNVTEIIKNADTGLETFENGFFEVRLLNPHDGDNLCSLIKAIEFEADTTNSNLANDIVAPNFVDATECILRPNENGVNPKYWAATGTNFGIHMSQVVFCSFTYDSYLAAFGEEYELIDFAFVEEYMDKGWIDFNCWIDVDSDGNYILGDGSYYEIVDEYKDVCPILEFVSVAPNSSGTSFNCVVKSSKYKKLGYSSMPKFLMGTSNSGKHMLRYVFEGLRTSLFLGVITFLICFLFGLLWGSISGYFGGAVDLLMERFTDILSGVPWIVVMTLIIIKYGSSLFTFGIALCLTGWIGTAATTRTQFYRFRSREYVLASRTLGASDARLIAKHILPNAMGTIITSAVLMIPSVIFSEATISYLGLGLSESKGVYSLGVILSKMQSELTYNPYLLIFPSVIIALLMISFNLFGNGLRDAVNPSLKGED